MKKLIGILCIGLMVIGCKENTSQKKKVPQKVVFNQDLANELEKMAEVDQIAAYIPQGEYKKLSTEDWNAFKDSVFTTHQKRIKELFDQHGFLGFDLVGKEGSSNFWVMVQHSDHNPAFQKAVLEKMKQEVLKKNAHSREYGLLTDRVNINSGLPQVYGTQVDYNWEICQAYPITLQDSANVNQRRKEIGLEPIEEYLNRMSEMHFEINKASFLQKGIKAPTLYKVEK
ncbi:DUF6624 domain-containing protein [Pseudotenacibaculum haliotis]|uniref:DUF6624 domain-containing protein n=1 Tax=Pseudotenacibaculum haliotis TaxID=1862138 RepID=A0ABW5LRE6_9FLAO